MVLNCRMLYSCTHMASVVSVLVGPVCVLGYTTIVNTIGRCPLAVLSPLPDMLGKLLKKHGARDDVWRTHRLQWHPKSCYQTVTVLFFFQLSLSGAPCTIQWYTGCGLCSSFRPFMNVLSSQLALECGPDGWELVCASEVLGFSRRISQQQLIYHHSVLMSCGLTTSCNGRFHQPYTALELQSRSWPVAVYTSVLDWWTSAAYCLIHVAVCRVTILQSWYPTF